MSYGKIASNPFLSKLKQKVSSTKSLNALRREKTAARKAAVARAIEALEHLKGTISFRGGSKHIETAQDNVEQFDRFADEQDGQYNVYLSSVCDQAGKEICTQLGVGTAEAWMLNGRSTYKVNGKRVNKPVHDAVEEKEDAIKRAARDGKVEEALQLFPTECHPDIQKIPAWRQEMFEAAKQIPASEVSVIDNCNGPFRPADDRMY